MSQKIYTDLDINGNVKSNSYKFNLPSSVSSQPNMLIPKTDGTRPIWYDNSSGANDLAFKSDVDNLQIGGRNFIVLSKLNSYINYNTKPISELNKITTVFTKKNTDGTDIVEQNTAWTLNIIGYTPEASTYTISGRVTINNAIPSKAKWGTGLASTYGSLLSNNYYDESSGRFVITQSYSGSSVWIFHRYSILSTGDVIAFYDLKFEKGNKATDWTPAPEDKQDRLQDIAGYIGVGKSDTIATEKLDVNGYVKATGFKTPSGTATQFLMADGSVDTFGTTAGTVAEGNDSRIVNGQTAYGWGNHASAGYALASGTINYIPKFTASGAIGNSLIYDNGTNIGIGTNAPNSTDIVHVFSSTAKSSIRLQSTHSTSSAEINFQSAGGSGKFELDYAGNMVFRTSQSGLFFDNFSTTGSIYFRTGGSNERMRIDNNGNIGIGTTTPSRLLHVNGIARAITFTADRFAQDGLQGSSYFAPGTTSTLSSQNNLTIQTVNSNTDILITPTRNVGIGTTSPSAKLDVINSSTNEIAFFKGASTIVPYQILGNAAVGAYWRGIFTGQNIITNATTGKPSVRTSGYTASAIAYSADSSQGYLGFFTTTSTTANTDLSERMRITSSGNVGIATTTPSEKLEVSGNVRISQSIWGGGYASSGTSYSAYAIGGNIGGPGGFYFSSRNDVDADAFGSAGIGVDPDGGISLYNYSLDYSKMSSIAFSPYDFAMQSGGDFYFNTKPSTIYQTSLIIKNTGNVGIGTTSPSEKLDVNGNIKASSFIKTGGTSSQFLKADGSVDSNSYINKSSINVVTSDSWAINNGYNEASITFINGYYPALIWNTSSAYMSDEGFFYIEGAGINQLNYEYSNHFAGDVYIYSGLYINLQFSFKSGNVKTNPSLVGKFATLTGGSNDFELLFSRSASGTGAYYSIQSVEQGIGYRDLILQKDGGRVGIGTTSPSTLLDVNSWATFLNNAGNRLKIWDGTDNIPTISADNLLVLDSPNIQFYATDVTDSNNNSIYLKLKTVNGNVTIDNTYHNKIVRITASCTITIPNNLRTDFNCTFEVIGAYTAQFVDGSGATTSAPFGRYLKTDLTAMFYCTGTASNYRLNGSLTTS